MTFNSSSFRQSFLSEGLKETSCNSYLVNLRKIDDELKVIGRQGLDETIVQDAQWLLNWAKTGGHAPFDKEASNRRSALRKYWQFYDVKGYDETTLPERLEDEAAPLEPTGQAFHLERDMQLAVRRQISKLEAGLRIADNNVERQVPTGEIDIVAKDLDDNFVVIELKAGDCPKGAMEQLLGYTNDLRNEEEVEKVRAVLIARSFSDRIVSAAALVPSLKLVTYDFDLKFNELSS